MTDVTDADQSKAVDILALAHGDPDPFGEVREAIAAALAEERAKARAPFLALAEELEQRDLQRDSGGEVAWLIREAAGETG